MYHSVLSATSMTGRRVVWHHAEPSHAVPLYLALHFVLVRAWWRHWCDCDVRSWRHFVCMKKRACHWHRLRHRIDVSMPRTRHIQGEIQRLRWRRRCPGVDWTQQLEGKADCVGVTQSRAMLCDWIRWSWTSYRTSAFNYLWESAYTKWYDMTFICRSQTSLKTQRIYNTTLVGQKRTQSVLMAWALSNEQKINIIMKVKDIKWKS